MSMWISIDLVIKYMLMTMDMIIVDYKTKIKKCFISNRVKSLYNIRCSVIVRL